MAQAAIKIGSSGTGQHQSQRDKKSMYQPNQGRSRKSIGAFSKQADAIKNLSQHLSKRSTYVIPQFSVETIEEDDFVNVVELALDLGLQENVFQVLKQDLLVDLSSFFDTVLDKLQNRIMEQYNVLKNNAVASLVEALKKDGYDINKEQYFALESALKECFITPSSLSFSDNSELGTEPLYLSLVPNDIGVQLLDEHDNIELSHAIYTQLSRISGLALIMTDTHAVQMCYDFCEMCEYIDEEKITDRTTRDDLLAEAIQSGAHNDYGMDKDEFIQSFETIADSILALHYSEKKINSDHQHLEDSSSLYKWFKSQIDILVEVQKDTSTFREDTGYYSTLQFCVFDINVCDIIDTMSHEFYELCDNQSKILIQDHSTQEVIDYLVHTAMARYLFDVFALLTTSGKPESVWSDKTITANQLGKFRSYPRIL